MSCIIRCLTDIENIYICSKPLKIDFMRKACINIPPSTRNQPPKQNLAVECRKKKKTLNTIIIRTSRQHHVSQHAIIQKPTAYFVKINKKDQKNPKNIPKILKIIIILKPEMNVTCKRDESIQLIHLCLCKLKVKHTHTVLLNSLPDTTDLCQWQRL